MGVVEHPQDDIVDPCLMPGDQSFECVTAAGLSPTDEIPVFGAGFGLIGQRIRHGNSFYVYLTRAGAFCDNRVRQILTEAVGERTSLPGSTGLRTRADAVPWLRRQIVFVPRKSPSGGWSAAPVPGRWRPGYSPLRR